MKDLKYYIIGASTLLVFYLVAQYNKPKAIDWKESFINSDKIPFGTYVIYNQVKDIFPGSKVTPYRESVYNVLKDHGTQRGNYIIISGAVNIGDADYNQLTKFVKNGNDVFIAAAAFGKTMSTKLRVSTMSEMKNSSTALHFTNPALDPRYSYSTDRRLSEFYFSRFDTAKAVVLGQNDYYNATLIKYRMGKGNLYLSANPLMFTNYSLLIPEGAAYASTALSYLNKNQPILWDEYYSKGDGKNRSSMRVFLEHAPLRAAFYISLAALLIFVIYEMKRRQRIIPVIEPLANTTVDFARVVGQVYYEQRNNDNIAQKKVSYFTEHIRTKYHLKTNVFDDDFIQALVTKSGAETDLVKNIVKQTILIRTGQRVTDADLISLNQNIEQFYRQSS